MQDKETNQRNEKGELHGEWIRLWSDNNIWWRSFFINGIRCGNSKVYDQNGILNQNRYYAR
jgi:antitoxin component YwqK of YwqJK toxin-antitoxin module